MALCRVTFPPLPHFSGSRPSPSPHTAPPLHSSFSPFSMTPPPSTPSFSYYPTPPSPSLIRPNPLYSDPHTRTPQALTPPRLSICHARPSPLPPPLRSRQSPNSPHPSSKSRSLHGSTTPSALILSIFLPLSLPSLSSFDSL